MSAAPPCRSPTRGTRAGPRGRLLDSRSCRYRTASCAAFLSAFLGRRPYLHGVAREEQVERPVDRHPYLALERRYPEQVVRPPQPPCREAGDLQAAQHRHALMLAEVRHLRDGGVCEGPQRLAVDRRDDVARDVYAFA